MAIPPVPATRGGSQFTTMTFLERNPRNFSGREARRDFNPNSFANKPLPCGFSFLGYNRTGHRMFGALCSSCGTPFHTREPKKAVCRTCAQRAVVTFSSYEEGWLQCSRLHEVNPQGEIRAIHSKVLIKPWTSKSGHLYVRFPDKTAIGVHLVVMNAFGPPQPEGTECRHLDGIPSNNKLENLEWGTRSQNIQDFIDLHGRHMRSKLLKKDIPEIISKYNTGARRADIAVRFGVSIHVINDLFRTKKPSHRE